MKQSFVIWIAPMGKPRQTRSDKWRKRECVVRYRAYADKIRANCKGIMPSPTGVDWVAYFPMPASWSKKKRAAMSGKFHASKPDRDNVDKGILDALFQDDQCVSTGTLIKLWDDGLGERIELTVTDAESAASGVMPCVLGEEVPGDTAATGLSHLRN